MGTLRCSRTLCEETRLHAYDRMIYTKVEAFFSELPALEYAVQVRNAWDLAELFKHHADLVLIERKILEGKGSPKYRRFTWIMQTINVPRAGPTRLMLAVVE